MRTEVTAAEMMASVRQRTIVELRRPLLLPALLAAAPVFGLAAAQGGYFPASWGWASVPLFWTAAIGLVLRDAVRLNAAERTFLCALAALAVWILLSATWSAGLAQTLLEAERVLLYAAAITAVLLLSRGRSGRQVLGGLLAAISSIAMFSLLTRLLPDRLGVYDGGSVYRLAQPIGYWNGLGLFVGIGALLAVGFAARARSFAARSVCAALLVVLLPTLYFTFGRGAWIALGVGLVAMVAIDPRRLQLLLALLLLAPAAVAGVFTASRAPALTHAGAPLARAAHDGHRVAIVLAILAGANAFIAWVLAFLETRVSVNPLQRSAFGALVVVAVAAALFVGFTRYGDPLTLSRRAYTAFKAPPPHVESNLNRRLLSFSGNGRADLWRLAWADARRHPLLGGGAGTYERYFLAHQPRDVGRVRDAHGLYVETLAELGPPGLALLALVLLTPLVTLRWARRHPLAPAAAGAYVAYLVHTGVDWDWELPAVTLAGLLSGASILLFARRWRPPRPLAPPTRFLAAGACVVAAAFAAITLLGNTALSRSEATRERGQPRRSADYARRAHLLLPWSPRPWEALGRAQLAAGLPGAARTSFRKALTLDSGDWRLWYDLASASTGAAERAALRRAVALFPRSGLLVNARRTATKR